MAASRGCRYRAVFACIRQNCGADDVLLDRRRLCAHLKCEQVYIQTVYVRDHFTFAICALLRSVMVEGNECHLEPASRTSRIVGQPKTELDYGCKGRSHRVVLSARLAGGLEFYCGALDFVFWNVKRLVCMANGQFCGDRRRLLYHPGFCSFRLGSV